MAIPEPPNLDTVAYSSSLALFLLTATGKMHVTPGGALAVMILTHGGWQFANNLYIKYLERQLEHSCARVREMEKEIQRLMERTRRTEADIARREEDLQWWRNGWHFEEEVEERVGGQGGEDSARENSA